MKFPLGHYLVALCFALVSSSLYATPKLIVVRHGHSEHNARGDLMNSNPDHRNYFVSNLTKQGQREVQESSQKLATLLLNQNVVFSGVFASPLPRTQQTAQIFSQAGLFTEEAITTDVRLTEVNMGTMEGVPFKLVLQMYPKLSEQAADFEGELDSSVRERVQNFLDEIKTFADNTHVIIFTHGYLTEIIAEQFDDAGMHKTAEFRIYDLVERRRL